MLSKTKVINRPKNSFGSHYANRKWSCYLENLDSSGVNNHLVNFEVI